MDKLTEQLAEALRVCADDLEAEVSAKYPESLLAYPCMVQDKEGDMANVVAARKLLAAYDAAKSGENISGKCDVWTCPHVDAKANGGWLPIESAPKDGIVILLSTQKGHITEGYRDLAENKHVCLSSGTPALEPFTHWQPLPPPPEQT